MEAATPETGSPVQFVKVPLSGVPSAGVVSVGEVRVLLVSVWVAVVVTIGTPSIFTTPALARDKVVSLA
jgi:hypothetical protein